MLDVALRFLSARVSGHLVQRLGAAGANKVALSAVVDENGKWVIGPNRLGLSVVNVEEERVLRVQLPQRVYVDGNQISLPPPLKLNLVVLLAAHFSTHDQALGFLSHAMTCLSAQPVFSTDTHADLDPRIGSLTVEMLAYGPEQLNQTWAYLGAKYLPSALYRVRLVTLQNTQPLDVGVPVTSIETALGNP